MATGGFNIHDARHHSMVAVCEAAEHKLDADLIGSEHDASLARQLYHTCHGARLEEQAMAIAARVSIDVSFGVSGAVIKQLAVASKATEGQVLVCVFVASSEVLSVQVCQFEAVVEELQQLLGIELFSATFLVIYAAIAELQLHHSRKEEFRLAAVKVAIEVATNAIQELGVSKATVVE